MALHELWNRDFLNILSNDSTRRDWADKDNAGGAELAPGPDTWSLVSSTVEAVARDLLLLENILVRQEFYQQRGEEREKKYLEAYVYRKRGS